GGEAGGVRACRVAMEAWEDDHGEKGDDRSGRSAECGDPRDGVRAGLEVRDRQTRELARLAVRHLEGRRVDRRRGERLVGRAKAVDAAFLQPLDLLGAKARAPRGLLDGQLAKEPCGCEW